MESGIELSEYHLAYTTYGKLNSRKDNVIWVFHALTANSDPAEWWEGLFGTGRLLDPSIYFIVCVNMPGSCYGSIGPMDPNTRVPKNSVKQPATIQHFFHEFPFFTTRDMARAFMPLRLHLGIERIFIGIGGSMGGQQLLEWAIEEPALFEYIFPVATNARHSPWGIAFNASQRLCIEADATWSNHSADAGIEGMKVARSVALLSYRNYNTYQLHQAEENLEALAQFKSDSYQRYQGEKLARRFNAFSYYTLSQSMDSHNVGRGRNTVEEALKRITAKTLTIGIKTDILFPIQEQQFIADQIAGAECRIIESAYGHDGFLLEYEQIEKIVRQFMQKHQPSGKGYSMLV